MAEVKTNPPSHAEVFNKMDRHAAPGGPAFTPNPTVVVPEVAAKAAKAPETPVATPVVPEVQAAPAPQSEMSEEEFLKIYQKMTGKKAKSLDDLKETPKPPTKEELEELEAKEKAESLEWALGSGKLKKEVYDNAIIARSKDKRDIALTIFTEELQAEDKNLTKEDCEERFKEYYCEEEVQDSWKRKKALREMNDVADGYLTQFNEIDTITEDYRAVRNTEEKRKSLAKIVKGVAKELPKTLEFDIPYDSVGGGVINLKASVPIDEKIVTQLITAHTQPGFENVPNADNPEFIAGELNYHIDARVLRNAIPGILKSMAEQIETDVVARMKNAVSPQQPILTGNLINTDQPKTPPSHNDLAKKMDKK